MTVHPGDVWWLEPAHTVGREQAGRRPAVVVSGEEYLATVTTLAVVVPVTTTDRGWPNHVPLTGAPGLPEHSFAMSEQVTTVSRDRFAHRSGVVDAPCLEAVRRWVVDGLV